MYIKINKIKEVILNITIEVYNILSPMKEFFKIV